MTHRNPTNGRAASIHPQGFGVLVVFGTEWRGEFIPSRSRRSKVYKTSGGAERSVAKWLRG